MGTEALGEFTLNGFSIDKGVFFRVNDNSTLDPEIAQNQTRTFNSGFYYGIVRSLISASDSADILSAEIHIIDTVDMDNGHTAGCFRNMIMTEGDKKISILQIVDRRPARSYLYVPPTET